MILFCRDITAWKCQDGVWSMYLDIFTNTPPGIIHLIVAFGPCQDYCNVAPIGTFN